MVPSPQITGHRGGYDVLPSPQIICHGGTGWSRCGPIPTNNRSQWHQGGHGVVTTPQIKSHGGTKSGHDVVTTPQIISHGGTSRSRRGPIPTNARSRQTHRHTHARAIKVSFVRTWLHKQYYIIYSSKANRRLITYDE